MNVFEVQRLTVWMRLGAVPASARAVALPACNNWPVIEFGKKCCKLAINQEQVGMVLLACNQSSGQMGKRELCDTRFAMKQECIFGMADLQTMRQFPLKNLSALWPGNQKLNVPMRNSTE